MDGPRYDRIGTGYAETRQEDARLAARIHAALGAAGTVVNVGAGTGSYEPRDRLVTAVEPSDVMAAQRPPDRAPAVRAWADALPLRDRSVGAAMAVLSVHHWDDAKELGVREMRRVARGPVVIATVDPEVSARMWLLDDYLPELAELERRVFPTMNQLRRWLGPATSIERIEIPRDTCDWTLMSFWAHPERVLDPGARAATSGFARMEASVVERVVRAVRGDLKSGAWDEKHGCLRRLDAYDAGFRLVVHPGDA